jgi:hypothetical protein
MPTLLLAVAGEESMVVSAEMAVQGLVDKAVVVGPPWEVMLSPTQVVAVVVAVVLFPRRQAVMAVVAS